MKLTVWTGLAMEMLVKHDREGAFSWEGMDEILNYYDMVDENMEFDVIEICCSWTEYTETANLIADYEYILPLDEWLSDNDLSREDYDDDDYIETLIERLESETTVLQARNGNFIVMEF